MIYRLIISPLLRQTIIVALLLGLQEEAVSHRKSSSGPDKDYLVRVEDIPALAFGRVHSILRDQRGFLWIGTTNGLHRYDGYELRTFNFGKNTDRQRFVTEIIQMGDDSILVATWNGLWTVNLRTEQILPYLQNVQLGDGRIGAICLDKHHGLWIGTRTDGVFRYNTRTGNIQTYSTENGLTSNTTLTLFMDHAGTLWVGTYHGLNSIDALTGKIIQYTSSSTDSNSLSSDEILSIDENRDGLWIGTRSGLNLLDATHRRIRRFQMAPKIRNEIWAMTHDPSGTEWVAVAGIGMFTYGNSTFVRFDPSVVNASAEVSKYVNVLYVDPTASSKDLLLWIGTRGAGVNQLHLKRNLFTSYLRNKNLPLPGAGAVLSLLEDNDGDLWVGLWGGGLNVLRKKNSTYKLIAQYRHRRDDPSSLPDNIVSSIFQDHSGAIWVGTQNGLGVFQKNTREFTVYKHNALDSSSLSGNVINSIYEDHAGTIWVCTEQGVSRMAFGTPIKFRNYLDRPQDVQKNFHYTEPNTVSDIIEEDSSYLLASMYGSGLSEIDNNGKYTRFVSSQDTEGIRENWIYNLFRSRNGTLWLATKAGLMTFDPVSKAFHHFPSDELHRAYIFGMTDDSQGRLWLSTEAGLFSVDVQRKTFKRYGRTTGLSFDECISDFCMNNAGELLVGGLDGFTEFSPDSIAYEGRAPTVAITSFSIFEKTVPASEFTLPGFTLSYEQNFFSFSFAALDFTDSKQNSYMYRMIGLDTVWVNAGHRNFASYTNIDPGEYTFEVRGANSDGIWSKNAAMVHLTITPPYWRTWWFRVLATILAIGAIYGLYRYRVKHLVALERLRLRIAHDLHDDVGSNLSAIAMASKVVQGTPGLTFKTKNKISEIYETAVATSEGMKDLVWFIKPETDLLENLLLKMKETVPTLLGDMEVDFHMLRTDSQTISVDFKRSVFLAFKEAVTNIARHAHATRVNIRFALNSGMFEMLIHDNGRGFDAETVNKGTGLHSMRKRAHHLNGICEINTQPQHGTTIRFRAKMGSIS